MSSYAALCWSRIKPLLINRYLVFLGLLLAYTEIAERFGGLPSFFSTWRLEIPLLLYLYFALNLTLRPFRGKALVAAAPIVLFYVGADVYFVLFGRLPQLIEIAELSELFKVFPLYLTIPLGLLLGLPIVAFFSAVNLRQPRPVVLSLLPLLSLALYIELRPNSFLDVFEKTQAEVVFYSDVFSTRNNGRLGMMLYNEARRKSYREKIAGYRNNSLHRKEFNKSVATLQGRANKRNIHLVVLESFLDPTLMKDVHFSQPPVDPSFAALFRNKEGFSISPVFAGGTAQAEFEVLCGVPALRELSGIEFNVFTGAKTYCLPNILTQGGYETIASNAFVPDFFNSTKAYLGLGFEETYYPKEYAAARETYLTTGDVSSERYMFDGELLSQNLDFISQKIKKSGDRPLFNYIIGIYGHLPHDINTDKRPQLVTVEGKVKDEQLERSANQYLYRTKALATFVKGLIAIDPSSLIILISDHLPPLSYGPTTYHDLNYLGGVKDAIRMNRVFIVENGQPIQYNTIHHYDIPQIILNYASQGQYCHEHSCEFTSKVGAVTDTTTDQHDEYMSIMAQAMGGCDQETPVVPEATQEVNETPPPPAARPLSEGV